MTKYFDIKRLGPYYQTLNEIQAKKTLLLGNSKFLQNIVF